ncbi:MAG: HEAT repeat domain-containing protein [Sedimentisphaerales bacterium]|jgi:hypothetical protein
MKVRDVQSLCLENASQLEQLRQLGADAIPACLDEIADKTSPASLRILLIEIAAVPNGHNDLGLGQTLMVIIGDATGAKAVRMQALQWIPAVGDQSAGVTLLQMLPGQTDPDLEFGVTRALRGFKVPGSLGALQGELADKKTYLTRIVAAHAVAAQGGDDALRLLQDFLVVRMAKSNLGARPEEDAVSIHGIMALGEVPSVTSLPLLQSVLNNPNNSVSLRNTAAETIGAIGGPEASRILRESMAQETNESVLVYVARGLARCGDTEDAQLCLNRRATVNDDFVKSELENAAQALQVKVKE